MPFRVRSATIRWYRAVLPHYGYGELYRMGQLRCRIGGLFLWHRLRYVQTTIWLAVLAVYALLHLVGQLLMSVYYVTYYSVAPNVPNITYYAQLTLMYILDIMCLGGPVCLFITR